MFQQKEQNESSAETRNFVAFGGVRGGQKAGRRTGKEPYVEFVEFEL